MKVFPQSIIKKHYNNRHNIITPLPLEYGYINNSIVYELSTGKGIYDEPLYGVTLVRILPNGKTEAMFDESTCVHSLEKAKVCIDTLRRSINEQRTNKG